MTCTEDQFRAILAAAAADITADTVPPLSLSDGHLTVQSRGQAPGSPHRRTQRWLVPLGAAAAVAAIAGAVTIVAGGGTTARPDSAAGVPRYYALATGFTNKNWTSALTIRDTRTGRLLASSSTLSDCRIFHVSAAADDRTFAVDCMPKPAVIPGRMSVPLPAHRLLVARFNPARGQVSLTAAHLPGIKGLADMAISPDGTMIATASDSGDGHTTARVTLAVYSIASGSVRSWSAAGTTDPVSIGLSSLSWGPGLRLGFDFRSTVDQQASGFRLLDASAAAGRLVAASRFVAAAATLPGGFLDFGRSAISANGRTLATTLVNERTDRAEFAEISLATGKLLRHSRPEQDLDETVLWTDLSGRSLIVAVSKAGPVVTPPPGSPGVGPVRTPYLQPGVLTGSRFTPLAPGPHPANGFVIAF